MYNIKHRLEKKAQQGRQKVGVSETVKTAAKDEKRDYKDDREREREREIGYIYIYNNKQQAVHLTVCCITFRMIYVSSTLVGRHSLF